MLLSFQLVLASACGARSQPVPLSASELRAECRLVGEIPGKVTLFEYANFWPDHCPGVAFAAKRYSSTEVGDRMRQLWVEDSSTHEKAARVWVRVSVNTDSHGPWLTIDSVRAY